MLKPTQKHSVPGKGPIVAVVPLIGRLFMKPAECPYNTIDKLLTKIGQQADIIFIDFHAEATSEKIAMGWHLDGRVSCVFGTHTHIQTADEKISSRGTAYLTDAGMTGPHESILGMEIGPSLGRFLTGMPKRFTTASKDVKLSGAVVKIDTESGRAESLERIVIDFNIEDYQNKQKADDY